MVVRQKNGTPIGRLLASYLHAALWLLHRPSILRLFPSPIIPQDAPLQAWGLMHIRFLLSYLPFVISIPYGISTATSHLPFICGHPPPLPTFFSQVHLAHESNHGYFNMDSDSAKSQSETGEVQIPLDDLTPEANATQSHPNHRPRRSNSDSKFSRVTATYSIVKKRVRGFSVSTWGTYVNSRTSSSDGVVFCEGQEQDSCNHRKIGAWEATVSKLFRPPLMMIRRISSCSLMTRLCSYGGRDNLFGYSKPFVCRCNAWFGARQHPHFRGGRIHYLHWPRDLAI